MIRNNYETATDLLTVVLIKPFGAILIVPRNEVDDCSIQYYGLA